MYAEACHYTGDDNDALTYINLVHNRAYDGSQPGYYTSLNQATMVTDPTDPLYNNPLRYERYVELFGEGGWYFDVCRWGIGAQEAAYYKYGTADYNPSTNVGPEYRFN